MNIDNAAVAGRRLLQADDAAFGSKRVSRVDRIQEAAFRIAKIGDGVERHLRHRLAEDQVEDQQVIQGSLRQPLGPRTLS